MQRLLLLLLAALCPWCVSAKKLTGTIIGTSRGYSYETYQDSRTEHLRDCALDGKLDTYFASNRTSRGWVGYDLGKPYVINKVGWATADLNGGPQRAVLGIFEGANQADFRDAVPLFIITTADAPGQVNYATVNVSRGFRYVRYMGTANQRCNIAEVEFWGYASKGTDKQFYQLTNLPTVVIHTENAQDPYSKDVEVNGIVSIISQEGTHLLQDTAMTRLRGNNSATHPKKPYRIKFDEKHRVLDSPAKAKKWTLINNYGDKTLMRNCVAFEISRRMGIGFTPFCQPVDVIVNGEYMGCYQLCDQIEVRKNRVDIEEMDSTCTEGEALQGGYLLEIDAYANKEPKYFTSTRSTPVTVKYPDSDEILDVQFKYIRNYYNEFEKSVYIGMWKNDSVGYRHYLNVPSLLRQFIVGELSGNTDTYWSTYFSKDRYDTQFRVEPVWDFDLAFENDSRTYPICNLTDYIYITKGSSAGSFNTIVKRMTYTDPTTRADLENMWAYARRHQGIDVDTLQAYVDSMALVLDASQRLNFQRWPIMNTKVHQNPVIWGSYEAEVRNVRDYIDRRIAWMDRKLKYDPSEEETAITQQYMAQMPDDIHRWDGHICVTGLTDGTPYRIYTLGGQLVGQGRCGETGPSLGRGTYIFCFPQGNIKKVIQ